ncbi:putative bifunctional diguanylate cyclase/phosphodiesterase [Aurantimonas marianensis]|uniref:EAL domain-containing protein n=1 Tax=Aurantimonas marianensis TaxID=2920428 RepID=A0A9X2HDT5_9HYPH|nr:EAL domain-containing protein [Aurantimonas marianensis]MCP3056657.1 EAL domain-containing protein [Aurantimonas marianensis]
MRPAMSMRLVQLLLAGTVVCFVVATGYISYLIVERQQALRQVSSYNTTWAVNQALVEFTRLEQRVAAFAVPGSGIDEDEVALRFEILLNRLDILQRGETVEFIKQISDGHQIVRRLREMLGSAEPMLSQLRQPGVAVDLGRMLSSFDPALALLASTAAQNGAERVAEDQKALLRLHYVFTGVAAGLIVCGVALILLLLWNNRLLGRAHAELHGLADDLRATSAALQTQNHRFRAALGNMSQGLCMFDTQGHLVVWNERFGEMFGLSYAVLKPGVSLDELILEAGEGDSSASLRLVHSQQQGLIRDHRSSVFVQECTDGRAISVTHAALGDGGWIATYEDITDLRRVEHQIIHMAHFDSLTDLANRVLFGEKLDQALSRARQDQSFLAIMCLDLDRFKDVNDTLGHQRGDELLKCVADRLRHNVRDKDLVARVGGDEFTLLLLSSDEPRDLDAIASRLIEAVSAPYEIDGQEVLIGLSIGIAEFKASSDDADVLLKQADLALYEAKTSGKRTFRFFEPQMDDQLQARKGLEADLRKALPNNELDVFYQPVMHAVREEVCGFEALIRWRHPTRGMIPPDEFIPVAEDIGLIVNIGDWVLRQACEQATRWPTDIRIAVNLSPAQFRSQALVQAVVNALAATGLCANRLELEITESVLLEDSEHTLTILHQLRELGVRVALDDFGTGYSSLSYLRSFPFDKIKIDQSFIRDMSENSHHLPIVELVIALGRDLGVTTTAEGVETEDQFRKLQALGCTELQGYFFGRPAPASKIRLSDGKTRRRGPTAA